MGKIQKPAYMTSMGNQNQFKIEAPKRSRKSESITLPPSSKIHRLCLQLAKTMQPVGPSSPRSQLTHGIFNGYISPVVFWTSSKFVKLVREYNNGEVHDRFKQILKDYLIQQRKKYSKSDVGGIASRIKHLVEDHSELRQGFKSLQSMVKADNLMKKIEGRLAINDLMRLFEILKGFRTGQTSMAKVVEEMAVLFADHMDLFAEFCEFLPDSFNLSE